MKNIVIVGVGALGSHVVQLLRNVDASMKVIDFDRVESKNTLSQFHGKTGVGKMKVLALQQTMTLLWGTKLQVNSNKVVGDNAEVLLGAPDLIIDCLDNGAARRIVQGHVRSKKIPCLHGALAADGSYARVVWDSKFEIDDVGTGGGATCEDGQHLPFISIASSYLARAAQAFLADGSMSGYEIHPGGSMRT